MKSTISTKQTKGGGQAQRNVLKPLVHQDCFFLRVNPPVADAPSATPPSVRWERRKKPANAPNPPRAGATMTYHKGRGIMFGGVCDVEEDEEGIESEFFNTLFAWNIERNRYFPLVLRKARQNQNRAQGNTRGGRRGQKQANEEELLRNLAALGTGRSVDEIVPALAEQTEEEKPLPIKQTVMEFPHARFNAQLAVQNDVLYIYGGTFEKGDREFTFDEMYSIDLGKLDGVREIFRREPENWLGSDGEDSDEDEDDEDEDEDESEDEDGDPMEIDKKPLYTESTRKSKKKDKLMADDTASEPSTPQESVFDDTPDDTTQTGSVDDGLPHPRPFESRRDFFQRTSNEWQEVLMTSLRWKGIQPETLSVKEIKTRSFEMAEEKWWECREEITALEDEQEAAGIGEVVAFADREAPGGAGGAGGAGRRR